MMLPAEGAVLFGDGGERRYELGQRRADGDDGDGDDAIRNAAHGSERGAVIDKELCTGDRADRADEELDNIGDDGFFRDGLIELLTLCPALDGDDGLVDVVVHGNDENDDE